MRLEKVPEGTSLHRKSVTGRTSAYSEYLHQLESNHTHVQSRKERVLPSMRGNRIEHVHTLRNTVGRSK